MLNRCLRPALLAQTLFVAPMMLISVDTHAAGIDKAPMEGKDSAAKTPWQRDESWPEDNWGQYNTLISNVSPAIGTPPAVSVPIEGDAAKGMQLAFDRTRGGSCVACHVMGGETPELPGNVGPDLSAIGKSRDDKYLFEYIYEPRKLNPGTVMPPWGTNKLFSVEEIKDIVAFLKTLKEPAVFKNPLDDPAMRAKPVEDRDNLDPIENPAMETMEQGAALFRKAGANGKACSSCHAKPKVSFRRWAAGMPAYSNKLHKVIGVEEFITRHGRATTGDNYAMLGKENVSLAIYLRYLANGTPINVDIKSKEAGAAAERGKKLSEQKIGQLNFACIDCHQKAAEHWIRGQWLGGFRGQTVHFPTWRTSRAQIWDIRKRFEWCNVAVRANDLPPDAGEYGDIELYVTAQNNGLKLSVPGIRH